MKQTKLSWIQGFLFDKTIRDMVTEEIYTRGHVCGLRIKFTLSPDVDKRLRTTPKFLTCPSCNEKTIWVLIRGEGDIELRISTPIDPEDETDEYEPMPVGIQRAISIWIPSEPDAKVGWCLYNNVREMDDGRIVEKGMKTFSQERQPANRLNFIERERLRIRKQNS